MQLEQEKKLREEFTNYERTVWLVNSIEGHFRKYYDSQIRYFDRYPKIPQQGGETCLTPDFTVVFTGPYEIVGEVKRALGQQERFEANLDQLKAYDGPLSLRAEDGDTYNHTTSTHDMMVLVNIEYARADSKKLIAMVQAEREKGRFQRAVCVFAATNDIQQARPRWILTWQDNSDKFRDSKLSSGSRLSERHQDNDEAIVVYPDSFAGVQSVHWFCNDRPPSIYVAVILWAKIFPRIMTDEQREAWALDSDCQGIIDIEVSVQAICDATRQFLSHYLVKATIKSVLEILRKAKLVAKKSEENYVVHFRRFRPSQFSTDDEDAIEEFKLDHQRESIIRAIVRGEKPPRVGSGRIPRRRKRFSDKNQQELF